MDDAVRDALVDSCRAHGTEMLDDPAKLEAFLRDTCPGSKREIHCLVGAVRDGAVVGLRAAAADMPLDAAAERAATRLVLSISTVTCRHPTSNKYSIGVGARRFPHL